MIAVAPTTLWSLTADRDGPARWRSRSSASAWPARAVRDQMSNDTWMVLAAVERAVLSSPGARRRTRWAEGDALLASAHSQTLAGMLALAGVAAESMVHDVGWTMMDIGKRIERGLWLTALLRATLTTVRRPGAEQTITESVLVACESSVIYRRRNLGKVSVAAVAELRAVRRREPAVAGVPARAAARRTCGRCPASSGSSRPERLVDEIRTPGAPAGSRPTSKTSTTMASAPSSRRCSTASRRACASCPTVITATQLSLPGGMQPLWGPDERRVCRDRRAFPDGPVASTRRRVRPLPGHPPHRVQVLRRRHQFLRPRLPHTARLRAPALPDPRAGHRPRSRRTSPPAATRTATSARTSTSPIGTGR